MLLCEPRILKQTGLPGQVAGDLMPRLIRETSGRDSKIPLDQYLEFER